MEGTSFECLRNEFRKHNINWTDAETDRRVKAVFPLVVLDFPGHRIGKDGASIEPALTKEDEERFVLRALHLMPEVSNNLQKRCEIKQRIHELENGEMFRAWPGVS
jgi:hypothetical protein